MDNLENYDILAWNMNVPECVSFFHYTRTIFWKLLRVSFLTTNVSNFECLEKIHYLGLSNPKDSAFVNIYLTRHKLR